MIELDAFETGGSSPPTGSASADMGAWRLTPITVSVRAVQGTRGPRLGSRAAAETTSHTVRASDHFTEYPCRSCEARLLTRAPQAFIKAHGGIVCPSCPASGVIATRAEDTVIPGFLAGPDPECSVCSDRAGKGTIAIPENGSLMSPESLAFRRGFSGTSKRGGRPRLSEAERRARTRDRKRRLRGISAPNSTEVAS